MNASPWDTIVIGSGMGGLACAAALANTRHRVLVLEQHSVAGGHTQTFERSGFTWHVGVHYVGFGPGGSSRRILDWLCDGRIDFASLGEVYDTVHFPDGVEWRLAWSQDGAGAEGFHGGQREGRISETRSRVRQEYIRMKDVSHQVTLEVRNSQLLTLESSTQQVAVSERGLELALKELTFARDRFAAGLTTNIEVTNAQTSVAPARDNQIEALLPFQRFPDQSGSGEG